MVRVLFVCSQNRLRSPTAEDTDLGPEILATGDHYAHEERYGVFVNVRHFLPALLSISAGQARTPAGSAGVTPYATMEFSMTF